MSDYFDSGFCVREPSWHGKETLLANWPGSWAEARTAAGLDWDPIERQVYAETGLQEIPGTGEIRQTFEEIQGWKQIVRSDTNHVLSIAKSSYEIIDHEAMGQIIEAVVGQTNVKFDTAGSVEEGRAVYVVVYLDEPLTVPGDNTLTVPYVAIVNRHDGGSACKVIATAVRIVCANTMNMAEMDAARRGSVFSFTHSKNWQRYVEEARDALTGARKQFGEYVDMAGELSKITITAPQKERFVTEFVPMPPAGLVSDRVISNVEKSREQIRAILAGPTCETINGTAFGLLQAAGEYLDHVRGYQNRGTYMNRTLLRGEKAKSKALWLAKEAAKS
jgi:phage/plasmid-like protein (TIGR03299 family)